MKKGMKGVNLGGWLVLERWITPALFDETEAGDEYSLCKTLGSEEASRRLGTHRESFITEAHIKQIADMGLDIVRLPVGYWLFGDEEPFVDGADIYVDRLLRWAEQYGLKVILDFHAAPGSQNGWDHSGRSGDINWPETANREASLAFLGRLAGRWGYQPNLFGIEVLNEPHWDVNLKTLVEYYQQAAGIIQQKAKPGVRVIVSDAFRAEQMSKAIRKAGLDVMLDVHLYQLFTPEDRALDLEGHLAKTNGEWRMLLKKLSAHHDVLVGEWSAAMSEAYGPSDNLRHAFVASDYEHYGHAQQMVFLEHEVSWTYWTARTQDGGVWSLLDHPEYLRE